MKAAFAVLTLLCASLSSALGQASLSHDEDTSLKVPGQNPLSFCHQQNAAGYTLQIKNLDLSPNPPNPGQNLTIRALGTLSQTVDSGFVHVVVKLGTFIKLVDKEFDICENAGALDEKCPLHKGEWDVQKEVMMPKEIPPAKFTVDIAAYTDDEVEITCMTGPVDFSKGSWSEVEEL